MEGDVWRDLTAPLVEKFDRMIDRADGFPNRRDFFAGCALIGMISGRWNYSPEALVKNAFEIADDMEKARK